MAAFFSCNRRFGIERGKQWYPFFHCDIMRTKNRIFFSNARYRRMR